MIYTSRTFVSFLDDFCEQTLYYSECLSLNSGIQYSKYMFLTFIHIKLIDQSEFVFKKTLSQSKSNWTNISCFRTT